MLISNSLLPGVDFYHPNGHNLGHFRGSLHSQLKDEDPPVCTVSEKNPPLGGPDIFHFFTNGENF